MTMIVNREYKTNLAKFEISGRGKTLKHLILVPITVAHNH